MPPRKYNKTKIEFKKRAKRIILPTDLTAYTEFASDAQAFRCYLAKMLLIHPELFPSDIHQGYKLHGMMPPSKKMTHVQLRRIQLAALDEQELLQVYTIAPCDLLPNLRVWTE
jgi:hypothetical protein